MDSRPPLLKEVSTEGVVAGVEWRRQARETAEEKSSTQSSGRLIQLMYSDLYHSNNSQFNPIDFIIIRNGGYMSPRDK